MTTNSYDLLHQGLKRFIYKKGWGSLRDIQLKAIKPILAKKSDVIIAASTASGKTEAAFLPSITAITQSKKAGVKILCISPLKALINDQAQRISEMASYVDLKAIPWHGDVGAHKRKAVTDENNADILIITPESLESLLINKRNKVPEIFGALEYIIIDEFHAFIDTPRGEQLASLMHRVETVCNRIICRIAISATFASTAQASAFLRPNNHTGMDVVFIEKDKEKSDNLLIQIRGYQSLYSKDKIDDEGRVKGYDLIAADIFRLLRGSSNLVFCNTKAVTETIANELDAISQRAHVPLEFYPHHGSLSSDLRESIEHRLKNSRLPTTAICTATLELGIDIADVSSIGQIDAPPSPASLRQRLGRSGRRDGNAVLRIFALERVNPQVPQMLLHLNENTVLCAATIAMILKRHYDSSLMPNLSLSTLIQQILSEIASGNGIKATAIYKLLCQTGPFESIDKATFAQVLRSLGSCDLIEQMPDGSLILGLEGERVCTDFSFYSAFNSEREFRIEHEGKTIGTIPNISYLSVGESFLFAGKAWEVIFYNEETLTLGVKPYPFRAEPLNFNGNLNSLDKSIRQQMYKIYTSGEYPACLNKKAKENIEQGLALFKELELDTRHIIESVGGIALFPWESDKTLNTIALILRSRSIRATRVNSHLELIQCSLDNLKAAVANILSTEPDPIALSSHVVNLDINKFDKYLSNDLKRISYARSHLDIKSAIKFFELIAKEM